MHMRKKAKIWLKRYLPAELVSSGVAVLVAFLVNYLGGGNVLLAFVASWAEVSAFYLYFIGVEFRAYKGVHSLRRFLMVGRGLIMEFGPAEILDVMVRPFFIYSGTVLFENLAVGVVVGKVVADVLFYVVAIVGFEFKRRRD